MEAKDIIERTSTEFISPLTVTVRPGGRIRICPDARTLNERMVGDYEQPPSIEEILAEIDESTIFTAVDLRNTFLSIELDKESRQYTRFKF